MSFVIKSTELAGFGLAGWVQVNGTIKLLDSGRFISEWPKEIELLGNTYVLEDIIKGNVNEDTGERYECAEYC